MLVLLLALPACRNPGDKATDDTGPGGAGGPALVFDGAPPTNLLVLSVDTLRKEAFEEGYVPFLSSLGAESVWTDSNTTCSSWTEPGTTCALSGHRAEEIGALPRPGDGGTSSPDPSNPTLATWMGEAGYHTTFYSANTIHNAPFYSGPYDQSFILADMPAADLVDSALETPLESPWMLHVHFFDPHVPYVSDASCITALEGRPDVGYDLTSETGTREVLDDWDTLTADEQAEIKAQLRIRYYGQVTCMDTEIARLWQALQDEGALDDTLVVFWTDHGEQLLDHDSIGHAGTMWPEVNDGVMFWWANNLHPNTITAPTTLQDLVPTTLTALGLPVPEVSGMEIGSATPDRVTFGTVLPIRSGPEQQVTRKGVRLRYAWGGSKNLYRHAGDPEENHDVYDANGSDEAALWGLLTPEVEEVEPLYPDAAPVDPGP